MGKGPKTKCTAELIAKVAESVRQGNYVTTAAAALGIPSNTVALWRSKGRRLPSSVFGAFDAAVTVAEAEAEQRLVSIVVGAAELNPKYALQYLTRRWADRFGRRDNLQVEGIAVAAVDLEAVKSRILSRLEGLRPKDEPASGGDGGGAA